jgi:hypothetical protein
MTPSLPETEAKALLAHLRATRAANMTEARRAIAWVLDGKGVRAVEGFLLFACEGWAPPPNAFDECVAELKRRGGCGGSLPEIRAYATGVVAACEAMAASDAWDTDEAEKTFIAFMQAEAAAHAANLIAAARKAGTIPARKRGAA